MGSWLNRATAAGFDALLWPVARLGATAELVWLALLAALLALAAFRFTSDQDALERARDRMRAHLLELWIWRDDLGVSARAQASLLRQNLAYLRHALVPLAVMLLPFVLFVAEIEARFAWRPLAPGEAALLTVDLVRDLAPSRVRAALAASEELAIETPPLRAEGRVVWRIRPREPGRHPAELRIEDERIELAVVSGGAAGPRRIAPVVYRSGDPRALLHPGTDPLAAQPEVRSVEIDYPRRGAAFAGLSSSSWLWLALSLLFALLLRRPLGVRF